MCCRFGVSNRAQAQVSRNFSVQMDKRKDPSSVDIKQVLLEMRKYRMGLIQTADQLRFSYLAVIEGAKFIMGDSSVQVSVAFVRLSLDMWRAQVGDYMQSWG